MLVIKEWTQYNVDYRCLFRSPPSPGHSEKVR